MQIQNDAWFLAMICLSSFVGGLAGGALAMWVCGS